MVLKGSNAEVKYSGADKWTDIYLDTNLRMEKWKEEPDDDE